MSRHNHPFRLGLALLLVGLIFGSLFLGLTQTQAGSETPQRLFCTALADSPVFDAGVTLNGCCADLSSPDPAAAASVCSAGGMAQLVGRPAGAVHVRYFPLWFNETRKTVP